MNIQIANRLVELRKQHGYSQEELAQELGISRQAISKWERAESSPDTDNLILLAKLYGISLDEMLRTDNEEPKPEEDKQEENKQENRSKTYFDFNDSDKRKQRVHIGWDGIHVRDEDEIVDISWDGIHVITKDDDEVHIGKKGVHGHSKENSFEAFNDGVYVNGKKVDKAEWWSHNEDDYDDDHDYTKYRRTFLDFIPYGVIVFLVFLYLGVFQGMWHPAWLLLFTIPVYTSFAKAIRKKNFYCFNYSMLAVTIFFYVGFTYGAWHPGWVIFITIPVYYYLISYFRRLFKKKKSNVIDINVEYEDTDKDSDPLDDIEDVNDDINNLNL